MGLVSETKRRVLAGAVSGDAPVDVQVLPDVRPTAAVAVLEKRNLHQLVTIHQHDVAMAVLNSDTAHGWWDGAELERAGMNAIRNEYRGAIIEFTVGRMGIASLIAISSFVMTLSPDVFGVVSTLGRFGLGAAGFISSGLLCKWTARKASEAQDALLCEGLATETAVNELREGDGAVYFLARRRINRIIQEKKRPEYRR